MPAPKTGMYISFDDGMRWESMQWNMPIVPITDLVVKNNNLIAATQGRSLWMIDDLTLCTSSTTKSTKHNLFFKPLDAFRIGGNDQGYQPDDW